MKNLMRYNRGFILGIIVGYLINVEYNFWAVFIGLCVICIIILDEAKR